MAGQGRIKRRENDFFLEPTCFTKSTIPLVAHGFANTTKTRNDGLYLFLQATFTKSNKISKIIFLSPLSLPLGQTTPPSHFVRPRHKKKREKDFKSKKARIQSKTILSSSSLSLSAKLHPHTTKNLKPLQRRIKARRKEGLRKRKGGRKKKKAKTSNSISNLIIKTSLIPCIFAILR